MVLLETTSGPLQQGGQKTKATLAAAVPVLPFILVTLHLHLWERSSFCESGNTGPHERQWYLDDPLWDSQGCASGSTCCDRGGPWFTTTLSQEARDDIELRMCLYNPYPNGNIGVDQLEIFIY